MYSLIENEVEENTIYNLIAWRWAVSNVNEARKLLVGSEEPLVVTIKQLEQLTKASIITAIQNERIQIQNRVKSESTAPYNQSIIEQAYNQICVKIEKGEAFTNPADVGVFLTKKFEGLKNEVFAAMFLNNKHELIAYEEMFRGTIDGAEVHPRVVVQRALELNAAAVMFAHNHPSGDVEASTADRAITSRLRDALALVDCRVLDHFIIGNGEPFSFAARGFL